METALVKECDYVIIDIDRNKTVLVNTAPKFGNSKFGKEVFERNQKKVWEQSWESCCILVALSKLHPCKLTNIENGEYFESLAITLPVMVWALYLPIWLIFGLMLVLFKELLFI